MFRQRSGGESLKECFRVLPHPLPFGLKKKKKASLCSQAAERSTMCLETNPQKEKGRRHPLTHKAPATEEGLRAR